MENLICEYCNASFSSVSSLNTHKKKTKYCLILQGKIQKLDFKCEGCSKILTSSKELKSHIKTCKNNDCNPVVKVKDEELTNNKIKDYENTIVVMQSKIEKLETQLKSAENSKVDKNDLRSKIEHLTKELNEKDIFIVEASSKIEQLEKQEQKYKKQIKKYKENTENADIECLKKEHSEQLKNKDKIISNINSKLSELEIKYKDKIKEQK